MKNTPRLLATGMVLAGLAFLQIRCGGSTDVTRGSLPTAGVGGDAALAGAPASGANQGGSAGTNQGGSVGVGATAGAPDSA
ncbi:MAG TPA: hypothetical protein VNG33_07750, partial [Polyangiaceae bacterium]|nr:hypothetical protein [Polyangiaceae bacterium]